MFFVYIWKWCRSCDMNLSYSNVINVLKSMVLQTCHVKYVFNMCYMRVLGKSFKVCLSVFRFYIIVFNACIICLWVKSQV